MKLDLARFTAAQTRAIVTDSREVLVLAGAGSGKTSVMVARLRRLFADGASPHDFMVLTFTRRAAGEMRERLIRGLTEDGHENADRIVAYMMLGTFHSAALRILRRDGDKIGLDGPSITIIDPSDADVLLKQVCRDFGYMKGDKFKSGLSWKSVSGYREALYTGQLSEGTRTVEGDRILAEYRSRMIQLNALDFGSILAECRRLLAEHPNVLESYRAQIRHVVVDEIQDSDETQFDLHDFFSPPATFFAVGDFRQSIYGWRGARPALCLKRHPSAELIQLRENFRSGAAIVHVANTLIAHNGADVSEPMIAATGRNGVVEDFNGRSADVVARINAVREKGFAWRDIAVMARTHRALTGIAAACDEANIPRHRVGAGFDICDTEEFRRLHAAMRLCVNHSDNLAFLRLVDKFGLSATDYAEVRRATAQGGVSHFRAMRFMRVGQPTELERLIECGGHIQSAEEIQDVKEIRERGEKCEDPPGHIPFDVIALSQALDTRPVSSFWIDNCSGMTFAEALEWFGTRDAQADLPSDNVVTLLTVHAAKGLEWPAVIVANLNDGEFPSSQSISRGECDSEERNVGYVAFTRAKEVLALHWRREEDQNGEWGIKPPSRFLAEAGVLK